MKIIETERRIKIYPYPDDTFRSITVSKPNDSFGFHMEAEVSWGSNGPIGAENAELYGKAIVIAAKKARELNAEYHIANLKK